MNESTSRYYTDAELYINEYPECPEWATEVYYELRAEDQYEVFYADDDFINNYSSNGGMWGYMTIPQL